VEIAGSMSIDIQASPESAFDLVADIHSLARLSPTFVSVKWIDGYSEPGLHARYQSTIRLPIVGRWTNISTIVEFERGKRLGFVVGKDAIRPNTYWLYEFQPVNGGVRVTLHWQMIREPWIVLIYYRLINQPERLSQSVDRTLRSLKLALEGSDPANR
jgi:hypothetical protein